MEVLKQDVRGRVRVPAPRREALLDEFEKSGVSGAEFARLAGINYQTFAGWMQKRRQQRSSVSTTLRVPSGGHDAPRSGGGVRLFEALVEEPAGSHPQAGALEGLVIELPGGSRMRIGSVLQMQMAAELIGLIAQRGRQPC